MLVAVLNTCSKEELEEEEKEEALISPTTSPEEHAERRKIIKNKILAVGRMARVFALLRFVHSTALARGLTLICYYLLAKNQRKYLSSRVSPAPTSCRMELSLWDLRALKMPLLVSKTRKRCPTYMNYP